MIWMLACVGEPEPTVVEAAPEVHQEPQVEPVSIPPPLVPKNLSGGISPTNDCELFSQGNAWVQAKMACGMAAKTDPENARVHVLYGIALDRNGDDATATMKRARELGSVDPRIDTVLNKEKTDGP